MGNLTDYNAALARVAELRAKLAEAEKALEDALPIVTIGSVLLRVNGEVIEHTVTGEWVERGLIPRTLDELRAMADAFLPERKMECIGYVVLNARNCVTGEQFSEPNSMEDAERRVAYLDASYKVYAPHRVVGLVEVEP